MRDERIHQIRRAIRGTVVDHAHLERPVGLGGQGIQASAQEFQTVPVDYNDANSRSKGGGGHRNTSVVSYGDLIVLRVLEFIFHLK